VTAISPTPAARERTTTTVGLADGLRKLGKRGDRRAAGAFARAGVRHQGGSCGRRICAGGAHGGHQPALHRRFHAVGAANNLLAAMLDNHIYQGNALNIDPRRITWRRCVDMNDRQLRSVVDGLGGRVNGVPR
jgi:formate--tetrahydrofolate ligase